MKISLPSSPKPSVWESIIIRKSFTPYKAYCALNASILFEPVRGKQSPYAIVIPYSRDPASMIFWDKSAKAWLFLQ